MQANLGKTFDLLTHVKFRSKIFCIHKYAVFWYPDLIWSEFIPFLEFIKMIEMIDLYKYDFKIRAADP